MKARRYKLIYRVDRASGLHVIIKLKSVKCVHFIRTSLRAVALIGIVADDDGRFLIQIQCTDIFVL